MLLLDTSAWAHVLRGTVAKDRASEIGEWMEQGEIAVRHREMMSGFAEFPTITITTEVECLAQQAQRELAEVGHHRLVPMDVIIVACAHKAEAEYCTTMATTTSSSRRQA